ncbi:MAG: cysteine hydrolase family protein [Chloroflexota bacterium]
MNDQGNVALLVIDVQLGLFKRSTSIYQARQVLENINILIDRARQRGFPVIFIQHSNDNTLVKGSADWQLHPEIQPHEGEQIIFKLHGNAFEGTNLQEVLEEKKVDRLVVTGLVTHGCVKATSFGAIQNGYKVVLVRDAHSNFSKDAPIIIEKWNRLIGSKGAVLLLTRDVDFDHLREQ